MALQVIEVENSSYWQAQFEKYRAFIIKKYDNWANIKNYTQARFKIQDLLGLFLIYDENLQKIAGFLSVFRPKIWPAHVARISNRTWIDPSYRLKGLSLISEGRNLRLGVNYGMTLAYDLQLNCCRKNNISVAVVTRENTKDPASENSFNFLHKRLKLAKPEWKLASDYYLTCSNEKDYRCWQRLAYMELKKGGWAAESVKMKKISCQEYFKRFSLVNLKTNQSNVSWGSLNVPFSAGST